MPEIAQTADHALQILEELGERSPQSAAQLSARLGLHRTVVHRLLYTLNVRGFVLRKGQLYGPGATLIRLTETLEPALRTAALPTMTELSSAVGETVVLHVADGTAAMVLEQVVSQQHVVQVSHRVGSRHPLARGASGRAILAFLPQSVAQRLPRSEGDVAAIGKSLEEVRAVGYAVSHDELQDSVHGIAVPLLGTDGAVLGSLGILVPMTRATVLENFIDSLQEAATQIVARYELPVRSDV